MTLNLILVVCLFGTTFAYYNHGGSSIGGWGGGMVVSRRDASADTASIYQLVRDTLDRARQSITAADLGDAALSIQTAADAYIDANGGEVPAQDVQDLIDDIASKFNGAVAVSALFDTPLTYEAYVLDAALCLLNGLVEKAEELEAAGSSPNAALAGISMTAKSIQAIVADTVGYITYMAEKKDGQPAKRWEFNGGINHGPGGTSYSIGVSHKWGKRRLVRSADHKRWEFNGGINHGPQGTSYSIGVSHKWGKRRLVRSADLKNRRQWSGGVKAGYSNSGGLSVSGGVSYSWRR